MKTVEERVHDLICDYITNHIRSNLRVCSEMKMIGNIRIDKDVKDILLKVVKIIPDNLEVTERSK